MKLDSSETPIGLLKKLKTIEAQMGREKSVEKGPRNIDLDLLLYDNETLDSDVLTIPHKSMLEREFVLRPLCEYGLPLMFKHR